MDHFAVEHLHDIFDISIMALALGMDAFSLSIAIAMNGLHRRHAIQLSMLIGVFHVLLTLFGLFAGLILEEVLGQIAQWFGAFLLIGLGLHMLYSTLFVRRDVVQVGSSLPALVLFAVGVSVDAMSVGFSLGLRSTAYGIVSAFSFGIAATVMCIGGLFIGKRANQLTGSFGELCGAAILIGYGMHFLHG